MMRGVLKDWQALIYIVKVVSLILVLSGDSPVFPFSSVCVSFLESKSLGWKCRNMNASRVIPCLSRDLVISTRAHTTQPWMGKRPLMDSDKLPLSLCNILQALLLRAFSNNSSAAL